MSSSVSFNPAASNYVVLGATLYLAAVEIETSLRELQLPPPLFPLKPLSEVVFVTERMELFESIEREATLSHIETMLLSSKVAHSSSVKAVIGTIGILRSTNQAISDQINNLIELKRKRSVFDCKLADGRYDPHRWSLAVKNNQTLQKMMHALLQNNQEQYHAIWDSLIECMNEKPLGIPED